MRRTRAGFTLLEVIVAITVTGLALTTAGMALTAARSTAATLTGAIAAAAPTPPLASSISIAADPAAIVKPASSAC